MRHLPALLLGCALALAGCGDAPSKADCEKLLDHLIDLEIEAGGGGGLAGDAKADLEKQKKSVRDFAAAQKFLETCRDKTPKSVVKCALGKSKSEEIAACDEGK